MLLKRCALDSFREYTEYKSSRRRSFNPTIEDPYEDSEFFFQYISYIYLYHTLLVCIYTAWVIFLFNDHCKKEIIAY